MTSCASLRSVLVGTALSCLLLALAACSDGSTAPTQVSQTPDDRPESTISAHSARIYLVAPVGVYQEGWAELHDTPDGLSVEVDVTPAEPVAQPAHIHLGSCAQLGDVFRPLENIIGGKSTTVVPDITIADVATGGMAINLHRSYAEFPIYTACGDIPALP